MSRILEAHLRTPIDLARLIRVLAEILELQPDQLSPLTELRTTAVRFKSVVRDEGFRMMVTLYVTEDAATAVLDDEALAERLAKHLVQDVAADPGARCATPSAWLLTRPDGTKFLAREIPRDDDILELDERPDRLKPVE
jgi:hypothetical protein